MQRRASHSSRLGGILLLILTLPAWLHSPPVLAAGQASGSDGTARQTRGRYKGLSLDDQVKRLAKALDLSETQQSEVKRILERQQEQGRRMMRDPSFSAMDSVSKVHALQEETVREIRAVLNDEQKKKYAPLAPSRAPRTSPQPSVDDWLRAINPKQSP